MKLQYRKRGVFGPGVLLRVEGFDDISYEESGSTPKTRWGYKGRREIVGISTNAHSNPFI